MSPLVWNVATKRVRKTETSGVYGLHKIKKVTNNMEKDW
jgi:hypothetical protein